MKKKAFSLLELSISAFVFLLLLSLLLPNVELFQKSYQHLEQHTQRRKEKIEFQILMKQLFEHSVSFEENSKFPYFVLDLPKATWRKWNIGELEHKGKEEGDSLLLQCIFFEEKEMKKKVFVLYFRRKNLYLGYYRMGYFQEGDSFCVLSEVEGKFIQKDRTILLDYKDLKNGTEEKIYYSK